MEIAKDPSIYTSVEVEYRSKFFCQQLATNAQNEVEEGKFESDEPDPEVWAIVLNTENMLRLDLAIHKRLPKEVRTKRTLKNLIKLLLRLKKLYCARTSAVKILRAMVIFKTITRCEEDYLPELFKQAINLRSALLQFRTDFKIFGSEFLYEEIDLYQAFEAIQKGITTQGSKNPKEAHRRIKQNMIFPSDMLRESYETLEVRNLLNDSLNNEEYSDMSLFDEIDIVDCDRTVRARSDLT